MTTPTDRWPSPPPDEPTTREQIAAFLQEAGYDPALVEQGMQELADAIIARERSKRIDAWLDTLTDEPLAPEEVEAIVERIRQERAL